MPNTPLGFSLQEFIRDFASPSDRVLRGMGASLFRTLVGDQRYTPVEG